MARDTRARRDRHALNAEGMVLCNPKDREAAHRAEMAGIATTDDPALVTCRKCLTLLHRQKREPPGPAPNDPEGSSDERLGASGFREERSSG